MHDLLTETFRLANEFNHAMTIEAVYAVTLNRLRPRGVTNVLAGIIPKSIVRPADQPRYVVYGLWPEEWAGRYFDKQYVRRDPTIRHAATQRGPLFWSEINYAQTDPSAERIMHEAREFNLDDGITIPLETLDGYRIGVSFSGDRLDRSPAAQAEYGVVASYSVARILQIRSSMRADMSVSLSQRQLECLKFASEGVSAADTGDRLGISRKIVERRLSEARGKLGALNTQQAIATAIRLGLLH